MKNPSFRADFETAVLSAMKQSPKPLSLNQLQSELKGEFKRTKEQVREILQALQVDGKIFVWGTRARSAFWHLDSLAQSIEAVMTASKAEPQTSAALKAAAAKVFPGISAGAFDGLLKRLLEEKRLFEHAPARKGGKARYAAHEPSPVTLENIIVSKIKRERLSASAILAEVLKSRGETTLAELTVALNRVEKEGRIFRHPPIKKNAGLKWSKECPNLAAQFTSLATIEKKRAMLLEFGFEEVAIDSAIRSRLPRGVLNGKCPDALAGRLELIVQATRQPVVSLPQVRLLLNRSKAEFDAAVLELRDNGRVQLYVHDHPLALNPDRRYELVADAGDRYYAGIALAKMDE